MAIARLGRVLAAGSVCLLVGGCWPGGIGMEGGEERGDGDGDGETETGSETAGDGDGAGIGDADPSCAGIGCECTALNDCAESLVCIAGFCGPCVDGQLGCACEGGTTCDGGLTCATADNGSNVCSVPGTASPCDHGLWLELDGVTHSNSCVAQCTQDIDDCGPMECSPSGPFAVGFCAWPLAPGQAWGPCPVDANGTPTLCYGEDLACVPADFGESNICLPIGGCPSAVPPWSLGFETGWGDACYPRCEYDSDCADGMVCGAAVADEQPMCAWPRKEQP